MNEQLQTERKSNLDDPLTTRKPGMLGTIDLGKTPLHRSPASTAPPIIEVAPQTIKVAVNQQPKFDKNIDLIFATIDLPALKIGNSLLEIAHCSERKHRHKPYYSTTITNRSPEKIRIDRFGTYLRKGNVLVLHSITGGFFSAQQFQEWYDLGRNGWLEPGRSVTDPNNHSNPGVYWAYTGTTASGRQFVAGASWCGGKSWWQLW
jgi:hypothetical protein